MITIYTYKAASDGAGLMYKEIGESLARIRGGESPAKQVLVVVPAQNTLGAEERAFEVLGGKGFFDLHVMSGNKFRHDIMRETGGSGRTAIDTLGRSMLLRKIVRDCAGDFQAFGSVAKRPEFLKLAGDFIVQLKQNQLTPADLERIAELTGGEDILARKLSDMQLVAGGYEAAMAGQFTDSEDELAFVTEKVALSKWVAESEIWYYGFYSFTAREREFLAAVAEHSCGLNIVLTAESAAAPDGDPFAAPAKAVSALAAFARERGIALEKKDLGGEEHFLDSSCVVLCEAANPTLQAQSVASEILRLVKEEGLRYGEIAVLSQDEAEQGASVERVLSACGIPVFSDSKRSVMHNPAAILLTALLDMAADGLYASNVLAFVKAGLLEFPDAELFANYVRGFHIKGKAFLEPFKYGANTIGPDEFELCEACRRKLCDYIGTFVQDFSAAATVKEKTEFLYNFLQEKLELPRRMEDLALRLSEDGLVDAGEEMQQVWNVFVSLFEQTISLIGGEEISAADYRELIEGALTDIKLGLLPQAEDRVVLGSVSRSRLNGIKALFIIGVNEGILPAGASADGILTDMEQRRLAEEGYVLSKSGERLDAEERFNIYQALIAPSEYLWLGYCTADASGKPLRPSNLVSQIKHMYAGLAERRDIAAEGDESAYLYGSVQAEGRLAAVLRDYAAGDLKEVPPVWKAAYNNLLEKGSAQLDSLRLGVNFSPVQGRLPRRSAGALFAMDGDEIKVSPSHLERFAGCPFKFFIDKGLRPKEEIDFSIRSREIGTLHHDIIMKLSEALISEEGPSWMDVTSAQLAEMIENIVAGMERDGVLDGIMSRSAEDRYRIDRVKAASLRFAKLMVDYTRRNGVSKMYFETSFGDDKHFPAVRFESPAGTVRIEGRIDRVDTVSGEPLSKVKVIDYKSGENPFKLDQVAAGVQLQLMLYLESALGRGDSEPWGIFYYYIDDSKIKAGLTDMDLEEPSAELLGKFEKSFNVSGLEVCDVLPAKPAKTQISAADFAALRKSFADSLSKICEDLLAGDISAHTRPVADKDACKYCDYASMCGKA